MTTHAQKVAPITRKKRKLKQEFFLGTFEYLDNLGLKKDSIKGGNYWLYYIDETPFFYVRNWSVYIDFRLRELRDLLSQIKGVLPNPKGSSLNHKFEHFKHYRNVVRDALINCSTDEVAEPYFSQYGVLGLPA